ncbi:MAG: GrpB family protein, partial [Candidatus Micrarchaeota archaeon]
NCQIELVGSASIPMAGKEELDICIEAPDMLAAAEILIEKANFKEFTKSPLKIYFNDTRFGIECELHLHPKNAQKAQKMKLLRDALKKDEELKKEFENFKKTCEGKTRLEYRHLKTGWLSKHCPNLIAKE